MVQTADFWNLNDRARLGARDRPKVGSVLDEREMGARLMVVGEVSGQDSTQVSVVDDQNVVEALAADRTDQALGEWILPGLCGAVRTSSICILLRRCRNSWP